MIKGKGVTMRQERQLELVAEADRRDGAVMGRESFKMGWCGELVTVKGAVDKSDKNWVSMGLVVFRQHWWLERHFRGLIDLKFLYGVVWMEIVKAKSASMDISFRKFDNKKYITLAAVWRIDCDRTRFLGGGPVKLF